ncbi:hypothetical protein ACWDSJ_18315 [Nocardia sp. NPDC003482]
MGGISAEAVAAFVAALALVVTTASVFYLARQTKAVAEQSRAGIEQARISNVMAAISANNTVLGALREVHMLMLRRPGTRRYFYENQPLPKRHDARDEIVTIAEALADVLCIGIHAHLRIPASESALPWNDYCRTVIGTSPVLRELVREHPTYWPYLPPLLPESTLAPEAVPPPAVPRTAADPGVPRRRNLLGWFDRGALGLDRVL